MKKIILPTLLVILAYVFYVTEHFSQIAAGVAIFLYGMLFLEEGFKSFSGGILEKVLKKATSSTPKSILFGVATTTLMQSSSLVSIITISFLSAGLITLVAGIGVILGANIGTTTGAWLVAAVGLKVQISAFAMPMLVFSIILAFQKSKYLKGAGHILAGLGFLFLGIHFMKEGFEAFKDNFDLAAYAVSGYPGLFLFAGIGVAATVVMQSSHATMVLILTALAAHQISYENSLALAIGANVGTTISAIIGSISSNIDGKRLAGAHLIFNVITGLVAIVFIHQFVWSVDAVSRYTGIAEDNYTMKLAVFHTLFNLVGVLLMLPFIQKMATFLHRVLPDKETDFVAPIYLSDAVLEFPETVVTSVRKEVWHLYDSAFILMAHGINLRTEQIYDSQDLEETINLDQEVIEFDIDEAYTKKIKSLYSEIVAFISIAQLKENTSYAEELYELRTAATEIVSCVKYVKHLRKNLTRFMVSENPYIKDEYNLLRIKIASILRDLKTYRDDNHPSRSMLELDETKAEIGAEKDTLNRRINKLLSNHSISAQMATSLLNDFIYSDEMAKDLIDCGQILLDTHETDLHNSKESVLLSDDDYSEIANKTVIDESNKVDETEKNAA